MKQSLVSFFCEKSVVLLKMIKIFIALSDKCIIMATSKHISVKRIKSIYILVS